MYLPTVYVPPPFYLKTLLDRPYNNIREVIDDLSRIFVYRVVTLYDVLPVKDVVRSRSQVGVSTDDDSRPQNFGLCTTKDTRYLYFDSNRFTRNR